MKYIHGGLPSYRHGELRGFTATLLSDVCSDVAVEPNLQPLSSETLHYSPATVTDETRFHVKAQFF